MFALIMAGGSGTRLWPVSRQNSPKQTQVFFENQTLLQKTYARLRQIFPPQDIYIATTKGLAPLIKKQLPSFKSSHLLIEPEAKNTAAAIALAAWRLAKKNPTAAMVTVNSDHYIKDEKKFGRVLKLGEKLIKKYPEQTVLIGVKPSYPETGYGYIKLGKLKAKLGKDKIYQAEKFVEKPNLKKAEEYLKSGSYLWNPAYFIWRVDYLLKLVDKHLPETGALLKKLDAAAVKMSFRAKREIPLILKKEFVKLPAVSIDYGLMEKLKDLLVIPADFGWTDIGHWRAVREVLAAALKENVVRGKHIGHDSHGNLIYSQSGKLVATIGIHDLIVVETHDVVLICPKDRAQEVKQIVETLKREGGEKYL